MKEEKSKRLKKSKEENKEKRKENLYNRITSREVGNILIHGDVLCFE